MRIFYFANNPLPPPIPPPRIRQIPSFGCGVRACSSLFFLHITSYQPLSYSYLPLFSPYFPRLSSLLILPASLFSLFSPPIFSPYSTLLSSPLILPSSLLTLFSPLLFSLHSHRLSSPLILPACITASGSRSHQLLAA